MTPETHAHCLLSTITDAVTTRTSRHLGFSLFLCIICITLIRLCTTNLCTNRFTIFGRPFVKRFALCYRTVVCLSCLSVALVYCGQTAGWIRMPLGMEVGLGPGHTLLDGDPAPPKGAQKPPLLFGPYLLWPNGYMDQDAIWYGGMPRPRPQSVRWGPISSKKGNISPQIFGPCLLWPNSWMDQDATW